jgi:hypothetical protein
MASDSESFEGRSAAAAPQKILVASLIAAASALTPENTSNGTRTIETSGRTMVTTDFALAGLHQVAHRKCNSMEQHLRACYTHYSLRICVHYALSHLGRRTVGQKHDKQLGFPELTSQQ